MKNCVVQICIMDYIFVTFKKSYDLPVVRVIQALAVLLHKR